MAKFFSADGQGFLQAVGTMAGMSTEAYQTMMVAGGRSLDGMRSLREQEALAAVADAASKITNLPIGLRGQPRKK